MTEVPSSSRMRPRAILVFRPSGLGDFILSNPAFTALRARFPHSRIVLLTLQSADKDQASKVAVYAGGDKAAPWTELVVPHLIDEVVTIGRLRSFGDLRAARRALLRYRFDLIVNMIDVGTPWGRRFKRMIFLGALVGLVRQIGWRRPGSLHTSRLPAEDPHIGHHVHGPMHFLIELDGDGAYCDADIAFDIRPGAAATAWAADWLRENASGARLIAIAPGFIHPHKSWPQQQYAVLTRRLLDSYPDSRIVVVGARADSERAAPLVAIDPARVSTIAGCSISQSAAFFAHCDLVVGNDGGAMHLADAMGARVVSIVPGIEFPNSIEPWHNREYAIRHPIECAPCYNLIRCPLGHGRCMVDIPLDRVFASCEAALAAVQ